MYSTQGTARTVAIGGGVSGALTAYHLNRKAADKRIIVVDPGPELGLGLAYSTPSLRHLLNVPAGKISALPQEPNHFINWLRKNFDMEATPATFAPRAVFGRYVQSLLASVHGVEQLPASVIDLHREGAGARLMFDNGVEVQADYVVLATGNFDPARLLGIEEAPVESGAYCHNAWSAATYANLPQDAPMTLIGTGLTGVDVVLRPRELGHRGTITAVSRHGIFPNRHATYTPSGRCAIPSETPPTCLALPSTSRFTSRMPRTGGASVASFTEKRFLSRSTSSSVTMKLVPWVLPAPCLDCPGASLASARGEVI